MSNQTGNAAAQADLFRSLHIPGNPVVLLNIWDAGSAAAVAAAGAKAIATGSAPVAMAHGYKDGEQMSLGLSLENITRIINSVELPVTLDLEGAYATEPDAVAANVSEAMATGIIGFNFEDQVVGGDGLHNMELQAKRVAAARSATDSSGVRGFINARTDIFLKAKPAQHTKVMLDDAIARAKAYEQAGADGFFAPGLADESMIEALCNAVSLPVNIIALPNVPDKAKLSELGVARISYGPVPYRKMISDLQAAAAAALA